jgi:diaminohydroxyphosphoribosylaminopyrimidine deaminase/5-amino-6-(5-phosphoribosylamino)uracil reductase
MANQMVFWFKTMTEHSPEIYMRRALKLAAKGRGKVSPNPMVGCVIVKNDHIIGEGWHMHYGQAHAEVNAINQVADKSQLTGADLYVSLEPCAHTGKTGPCANLVASFPFRKVYICNIDSNPLVAGKGLKIIQTAGIQTETGILKEEGERLNARFFTFMQKKRPYIILKWAETADGFIARKDYTSKWISGNLSRQLVHKWRAEEEAIMIGTNTARYDNPSLNVRDWSGNNPTRIVLDRNLSLAINLNIFDQSQTTLCYNQLKSDVHGKTIFIKLDQHDAWLPQILTDLYNRKIQSVLVEGGSALLNSFIENNYWDEIRRFKANDIYFKEGIPAPTVTYSVEYSEKIQNDQLEIFLNNPN